MQSPLNPYSGCSFGCSYCYAAFFSRDQAQQDNWGLWVNAKQNAAQLIEDLKPGELDGKRIYMSSVTDPYQPLEQRILLTQQILEKLAGRHRPKLVVQTRSPLVTRDIPLFQEIEQGGEREWEDEEAGLGDAQVEYLMSAAWDAGRAAGLKELNAYDPGAHDLLTCRCWCCEAFQIMATRLRPLTFGRS